MLLLLLACAAGDKAVDDSAPDSTADRAPEFRFTRFAESEQVAHERVPTELIAQEGAAGWLRFHYQYGAEDAGPGGVSGAWQEGEADYPYQLWVPEDAEGPLPLTLLLHTRGEQGDDNQRQISTDMAQAWVDAQEEPTLLLAPQAPTDAPEWQVEALDALLAGIIAERDVDLASLYIVGHSFGGAGTLGMLSESEHDFVAASLFAPSGDAYSSLDLERLRSTAQWIVVSEADRIVDADTVEAYYDSLTE
ncbi:MAG: hypothetical protein H6741_00740 [Alphaproteobacteria bacterium]|nr:hypothetical protein [Alphaproteobacteria bacterium]